LHVDLPSRFPNRRARGHAERQARGDAALDLEREGVSGSFFFWIEDLTLKEHLKWLVGINLVFWILQGAVLYRPTWGTSVARSLGLGLLILTLFSTGLRWHYDSNWNYGVVLAQRVEVYSGTGADKHILFHLHEGAIVTLSEQSDRVLLNKPGPAIQEGTI